MYLGSGFDRAVLRKTTDAVVEIPLVLLKSHFRFSGLTPAMPSCNLSWQKKEHFNKFKEKALLVQGTPTLIPNATSLIFRKV
jgi:hypothetical protein